MYHSPAHRCSPSSPRCGCCNADWKGCTGRSCSGTGPFHRTRGWWWWCCPSHNLTQCKCHHDLGTKSSHYGIRWYTFPKIISGWFHEGQWEITVRCCSVHHFKYSLASLLSAKHNVFIGWLFQADEFLLYFTVGLPTLVSCPNMTFSHNRLFQLTFPRWGVGHQVTTGVFCQVTFLLRFVVVVKWPSFSGVFVKWPFYMGGRRVLNDLPTMGGGVNQVTFLHWQVYLVTFPHWGECHVTFTHWTICQVPFLLHGTV